MISTAESQLLKRLIDADRTYRTKVMRGEPAHNDERGVEATPFNGVYPRTARKLIEEGLAEGVDLFGHGSTWLFLGKYEPLDN